MTLALASKGNAKLQEARALMRAHTGEPGEPAVIRSLMKSTARVYKHLELCSIYCARLTYPWMRVSSPATQALKQWLEKNDLGGYPHRSIILTYTGPAGRALQSVQIQDSSISAGRGVVNAVERLLYRARHPVHPTQHNKMSE